MRYALIIAGGSGTRLWPMSRKTLPKQLIPFIKGKSLLQIAMDRLDGLVPTDQQYICAGNSHRAAISDNLNRFNPKQFLGEPIGRDTLNAVGFAAAVIHQADPQAVIATFTADHLIEPIDRFQQIVSAGFEQVQANPNTLVTFGITPTSPTTGYGYLQLGSAISPHIDAYTVEQFKEKPDAPTAKQYLDAGPDRYLWNSGMFVWRAATLLDCIKRYAPENHAGLTRIAKAWGTDQQQATVEEVYPTLPKISVDYAVMEPASKDPAVQVAAIAMPLQWLDVGSWPAFAQTCPTDSQANAIAANKHILIDTTKTLVACDNPDHLITTIGCDNLIIIHTRDATLICHADKAEEIKALHAQVGERFGEEFL